jgi:formate dehydrogenase subunit gamma
MQKGRQIDDEAREMTADSSKADTVELAIAARMGEPGALLPILHNIQEALGYIPQDAISRIAHALNLSRAEVYGVLTYYHYFRSTPPARVTVALCRAEACRSMGTEALAQHIEAQTSCRFDAKHGRDAAAHAERDDVELQSAYCLGQCALSPAMTINGTLYAKMTPHEFDALFDAACASAGVEANAKESL